MRESTTRTGREKYTGPPRPSLVPDAGSTFTFADGRYEASWRHLQERLAAATAQANRGTTKHAVMEEDDDPWRTVAVAKRGGRSQSLFDPLQEGLQWLGLDGQPIELRLSPIEQIPPRSLRVDALEPGEGQSELSGYYVLRPDLHQQMPVWCDMDRRALLLVVDDAWRLASTTTAQ